MEFNFMKTKHLFLISLFLIILLVLPASFASSDDSASLSENNEADLKISPQLNDYEAYSDNTEINPKSMETYSTNTQKSDGESGDLGAAITERRHLFRLFRLYQSEV